VQEVHIGRITSYSVDNSYDANFFALAGGGSIRGILTTMTIRAPSFVSMAQLGADVAGIGLGVGLNAQIDYLMGFPLATMRAKSEINSK
jgi:hypothetical protein